jgi:poly(3-hydroxybutyrate) depolymerase
LRPGAFLLIVAQARWSPLFIIPDYPWDRPEPWHKSVDRFDKPEQDREAYVQTVADLRRSIDMLLARNDVDPKRLAYVGHSYGAQWGSILAAVDKRMKAAVRMAGWRKRRISFYGTMIPD